MPLQTIWETCKNCQIFIWMNACVLFHMTQLIFRSTTKTTVVDQINRVSKTIKHRTRWNERKTAFLVHSQQHNTGALLSASELPGGSARPSDGNSSCVVTQKNASFSMAMRRFQTFPPSDRKHVLNACTKRATSGEYHLVNATKSHTSTQSGWLQPESTNLSQQRKSTARVYELTPARQSD